LNNYNLIDTIFQTIQSPNDVRVHSFSRPRKSTTNYKSSSYNTNYSRKGKIVDKKNFWKWSGIINYIDGNRVPWYYRILIILTALLIAAAVVIPLVFIVFKNSITATTSMMHLFLLICHYWESQNIELLLIAIKR